MNSTTITQSEECYSDISSSDEESNSTGNRTDSNEGHDFSRSPQRDRRNQHGATQGASSSESTISVNQTRNSRYIKQFRSSEGNSEDRFHASFSKEKRMRFTDHYNSYDNFMRNENHITTRHKTIRKIYKYQFPTTTIIIKGLVQTITENDIWKEAMYHNAAPTDIRLIRNKGTGELRGFAFLVFRTVEEASQFMELNDGELFLGDKCRGLMEYSIPREYPNFERSAWSSPNGWCCVKCGFINYTCRDICYKCSAARKRSLPLESEKDEVCPYPTTTVLLRCLDVLSTEDSVLTSLQDITSLPIRKIQIGQDSLTKISRGVCYIEMNSIADSVKLFTSLTSQPFTVDNKRVIVSYCKHTPLASNHSLAVCNKDSNSQNMTTNLENYNVEDIQKLAEYSASLYATTPHEYEAYLKYYRQYYEIKLNQKGTEAAKRSRSSDIVGKPSSLTVQSKDDKQIASADKSNTASQRQIPSAESNGQFPPDAKKFVFDESSGYYFNKETGLHYDAVSKYYYDANKKQFLYWDVKNHAYMTVIPKANETCKQNGKKEVEKNKEDKIKVAKKVVKEMERWAKILNEKRDIARQNKVQSPSIVTSTPNVPMGSADVGFSVLDIKETVNDDHHQEYLPALSQLISYDSGNESEEVIKDEIGKYINWDKLVCLLCKRQFQTKECLEKHLRLSTLHQQNFEKWYRKQSAKYGLKPNSVHQNSVVCTKNASLTTSGWQLNMNL